jgi:hypothetical protein
MIRGQAIKVSALISGSVGVLCAGNYLAFLPSPAVEILVMLLIIGAVLCLGMAIYLWVGIVSSKKEISLGELETRKSLKKMLIWVWVLVCFSFYRRVCMFNINLLKKRFSI